MNYHTLFFHATFTSRLSSIMSKGLVIGKKRNWSDMFGGRQGSNKHIYLFHNLTAAAKWGCKMENDFGKPISIVIITNLPNKTLDDPNLQMSCWYTASVMYDQPILIDYIVCSIPLNKTIKDQLNENDRVELPHFNYNCPNRKGAI